MGKKTAKNEFNQEVKGSSLTHDAWKRLRKNKMAIAGLWITVIYAFLSIAAPILPIYSYKKIILDHQNLPPAWGKTAGEMIYDRQAGDFYLQAVIDGRLKLEKAEKKAFLKMPLSKKRAYLMEKAEAGLVSLTPEQEVKMAALKERIGTELLFDIRSVSLNTEDGSKKLSKLSSAEMTGIVSRLTGQSSEEVLSRAEKEIDAKISTEIRSNNEDLSGADLKALVASEKRSRTEAKHEAELRTNLEGRIIGLAEDRAEVVLAESVSAGAEFPLTQTFEADGFLTVTVKASKLHDRVYHLGTDYAGRDMLARIIYGGQVSMAIGLIGTFTSVLIGIILGALAGYLGGKTDYIIMRIVDIMYGLPYMLLVIIFMAIFGRNIMNLFLALSIVSWLTVARVVRGQVISLKNSEFVEAARSMGASTGRIVFRHLVPNTLGVIIVFATLRIPAFIMQESFLSFLGLGISAPYASWGALVGDAVEGMSQYPWRLVYPALAMTIFLFAMNFLGDGLRDAFDPQSKNRV